MLNQNERLGTYLSLTTESLCQEVTRSYSKTNNTKMVLPAGLEPATRALEKHYSNPTELRELKCRDGENCTHDLSVPGRTR